MDFDWVVSESSGCGARRNAECRTWMGVTVKSTFWMKTKSLVFFSEALCNLIEDWESLEGFVSASDQLQ